MYMRDMCHKYQGHASGIQRGSILKETLFLRSLEVNANLLFRCLMSEAHMGQRHEVVAAEYGLD